MTDDGRSRKSAGKKPTAARARKPAAAKKKATVKKPVARKKKAATGAKVVPIRKARSTQREQPNGPGRPTSLTEKVQADILAAVRVGNYLDTAARYAGVNPATFYNWMARGRKELERVTALQQEAAEAQDVPLEAIERPALDPVERRYVEFFEAVQRADAEFEVRSVTLLADHSARDPRSAQWMLERKYARRWGRTERHEVEMSGSQQPIRVELSQAEAVQRERQIVEVLLSTGAVEAFQAQALPAGDEDEEEA